MNDKEYNELEGIRRSDLWIMNKTPAHFIYHMNNPEPKTDSLIFGSAIHKFLLEPRSFESEYAVLPENIDRRTKEGKEAYLEFVKQSKGKEVITLQTFKQIVDMTMELHNDALVNSLLNEAEKEKAFTWVDADTKEECKIKADAISTYEDMPVLIDYKTTQSCENGAFERSAKKYGYDFQAGMYCEGVEVNTMQKHGFIFIAQEKNPPYLHRIYICSPEFIQMGKDKYHELLRFYHNCKIKNEWLGYAPTELLEEYY